MAEGGSDSAPRRRRSSLANNFKNMLAPLTAGATGSMPMEQRVRRNSTVQLELQRELDGVEQLMKDMTSVSKTIVLTHKRTQQHDTFRRRRTTDLTETFLRRLEQNRTEPSDSTSLQSRSFSGGRRRTDSALDERRPTLSRRKSQALDPSAMAAVRQSFTVEMKQRAQREAFDLNMAAEATRRPPLLKRMALKVHSVLGNPENYLEGMFRPYQLFEAAGAGKTTVVHNALLSGLPINLQDQNGMSPLCHAAAFGHLRTAVAILEFGQDEEDATRGRAVDPMVKCYANGWSALHYAARHGHSQIISAILGEVRAAPVQVDARDNMGCTPLILAAHHGHEKCVAALLSADAPPRHRAKTDQRDAEGMTALCHAGWKGKASCCRALLKAGADKDKRVLIARHVARIELE